MATRTKALAPRHSYRYVRHRVHHKAKFTIPVAAIAGFGPLLWDTMDNVQNFGYAKGIAGQLSHSLTGYDMGTHKFDFKYALAHGWGPITAGIMVHKLASKLGVNRALGRAGIPLLRI